MRKILLITLIVLVVLNCLSFVIARIVLFATGGPTAKFEREMKDLRDGAWTYLIAGNLNQARTAFQFLRPELHGYVSYVQFDMMGWSAHAAAKQIVHHVKRTGARTVRVYTISLGDHVGRYLEQYLGNSCDLKIIAINPCTDVSFVRQPLRTMLKIGAPIFEVLCHGLGWLSTIPFIPTPDGKYSLILLADQYWSIAYDHPMHLTDHTIGVICSQPGDDDNDGLLENAAIRNYFRDTDGFDCGDGSNDGIHVGDTDNDRVDVDDGTYIVTIETDHGTTMDCGDEYLDGVRQIWQHVQSAG